MSTEPTARDERRRARREMAIRVIDILIFVAVFLSGGLALFAVPLAESHAIPTLLTCVWGGLLIVGGSLGAIGRISRVWLIEMPGVTASIFGVAIYVVIVLGIMEIKSLGTWLILALVFTTWTSLVRRYLELQLFTSEPGSRLFTDRMREMVRRRTANTARH